MDGIGRRHYHYHFPVRCYACACMVCVVILAPLFVVSIVLSGMVLACARLSYGSSDFTPQVSTSAFTCLFGWSTAISLVSTFVSGSVSLLVAFLSLLYELRTEIVHALKTETLQWIPLV